MQRHQAAQLLTAVQQPASAAARGGRASSSSGRGWPAAASHPTGPVAPRVRRRQPAAGSGLRVRRRTLPAAAGPARLPAAAAPTTRADGGGRCSSLQLPGLGRAAGGESLRWLLRGGGQHEGMFAGHVGSWGAGLLPHRYVAELGSRAPAAQVCGGAGEPSSCRTGGVSVAQQKASWSNLAPHPCFASLTHAPCSPRQVVSRANAWAESIGLRPRVHFLQVNAATSLDQLLSSYPGPLQLVTANFPDPGRQRERWASGMCAPQRPGRGGQGGLQPNTLPACGAHAQVRGAARTGAGCGATHGAGRCGGGQRQCILGATVSRRRRLLHGMGGRSNKPPALPPALSHGALTAAAPSHPPPSHALCR